jgi:hypothetical protein
VRNEDGMQEVKWERKTLQTVKRRKGNLTGHILRKNCLLRHVIEGNIEGRIEVTGRRGRRKELLDVLKKKRGYWKLTGGSTRSDSLENSLCKRLCTCYNTLQSE